MINSVALLLICFSRFVCQSRFNDWLCDVMCLNPIAWLEHQTMINQTSVSHGFIAMDLAGAKEPGMMMMMTNIQTTCMLRNVKLRNPFNLKNQMSYIHNISITYIQVYSLLLPNYISIKWQVPPIFVASCWPGPPLGLKDHSRQQKWLRCHPNGVVIFRMFPWGFNQQNYRKCGVCYLFRNQFGLNHLFAIFRTGICIVNDWRV